MAVFVLTYDLIGRKDYQSLWDELIRLGGHRALASFWLLNLNNTAVEVHDHFRRFLDHDDRLWVSALTRNTSYSNPIDGTDPWIAVNFAA